MTTSPNYFPTDTAGLPSARPPETIELAAGDEFDLRIAPVAKKLGEATVRMLAYNGSVPGRRDRQKGSRPRTHLPHTKDHAPQRRPARPHADLGDKASG